jgi:hypothetical protein
VLEYLLSLGIQCPKVVAATHFHGVCPPKIICLSSNIDLRAL